MSALTQKQGQTTRAPVLPTHLQTFHLCLLKLEFGLDLADLGLLPADQRFVHHGLFLKLQLTLQGRELSEHTQSEIRDASTRKHRPPDKLWITKFICILLWDLILSELHIVALVWKESKLVYRESPQGVSVVAFFRSAPLLFHWRGSAYCIGFLIARLSDPLFKNPLGTSVFHLWACAHLFSKKWRISQLRIMTAQILTFEPGLEQLFFFFFFFNWTSDETEDENRSGFECPWVDWPLLCVWGIKCFSQSQWNEKV